MAAGDVLAILCVQQVVDAIERDLQRDDAVVQIA